MSIMEKIGATESAFAFLDRAIKWAPIVIGTTFTGTVTGLAAKLTTALDSYSPFSWTIATLTGGCLFLLSAWIWSAARVNLERIEYAKEQSKIKDDFNPVDQIYTKKRIFLQNFRTQFNDRVSNKTFVDCELYGPAVIFLSNKISLSGINIAACEFVCVKNGSNLYNCIVFEDFTVTRGKMRGLTIFVHESLVPIVNSGVAGIKWTTHTP